jgi:hypothetical protein
VTEWYHLPTGVAEECRSRVRELLLGDSFLYKEVQAGDVSLKAWFVREELFKLLRSHIFNKDSNMGRDKYTKGYFKPLRWPTVLLACTALRCALMDYEETGRRGGAIAEFSSIGFSGWYNPPCRLVSVLIEIKTTMRGTARHI